MNRYKLEKLVGSLALFTIGFYLIAFEIQHLINKLESTGILHFGFIFILMGVLNYNVRLSK